MNAVLKIIININIFILLSIIIYLMIYSVAIMKKLGNQTIYRIENSKIYRKMKIKIIKLIYVKNIQKAKNIFTPMAVMISSMLIILVTFIFVKCLLGSLSSALITAVIAGVLPYVLVNIILNIEKKRIKNQLPSYIINIKNHIENSNNITLAMRDTEVLEPLSKYVRKFNNIITSGVNIQKAFDILKSEVDIKIFTSFVNAVSTCNDNGGNFNAVLSRFSEMTIKENIEKEKLKETTYSSMLTLGIMLLINIYILITFVFSNGEYSKLIKETIVGNIILNLSILTYAFIGYLIIKIYGTEE